MAHGHRRSVARLHLLLAGAAGDRPAPTAGVRTNIGTAAGLAGPRREAVPATDFISVERKFTEVCVFTRPLAELVAPPNASPCRNVLDNDHRLGAASSCPRTTVQGHFVEVAASWTEEGAGGFFSNDCSDGEFIRQGERVLTLSCRTADLSQGSRPICGMHFRASVVIMTPSHDFGEPGREHYCDQRSTVGRSRRTALRFLAGSSLRSAHSTALRKFVVWVYCHSAPWISCAASQ